MPSSCVDCQNQRPSASIRRRWSPIGPSPLPEALLRLASLPSSPCTVGESRWSTMTIRDVGVLGTECLGPRETARGRAGTGGRRGSRGVAGEGERGSEGLKEGGGARGGEARLLQTGR